MGQLYPDPEKHRGTATGHGLLGSKQDDHKEWMQPPVAKGDKRPPNFRQLALTALALFCPIGLLAIRFSLLVNRKYQHGDMESADAASRKALRYSQMGILSGIVAWGVLLLLVFTGALIGVLYMFDYFHSYRPL